jgi:hypothetical protein
MKRVYFWILCVFWISACGDHSGKKTGEITSVLAAEIVAMPEPDRYQVRLSWKKTMGASLKGWLIQRTETANGDGRTVKRDANDESHADTTVEAGKRYHYALSRIEEKTTFLEASADVEIPKDLEVQSIVEMEGSIRAGRVFLRQGSRILTRGKDLIIDAMEVLSDNGTIETFPVGQRASVGAAGRSGGRLIIRARRGTGVLQIFARGEAGGSGGTGAWGRDGKRGQNGEVGLGTHERVDVVCTCHRRARSLMERMKTFDASGLLARMEWLREQGNHRCIRQPTDGLMGESGGRGSAGGDGGAGGASARVLVKIEETSDLAVNVLSEPGRGGAPGRGGRGGAGGLGGAPGDHALDFFFVCRNARSGSNGLSGEPGVWGKQGRDGSRNSTCVIQGKNAFGSCEASSENDKDKRGLI